jgi:TolB protein
MAYGQGDPRVYLLNIETNQREIVGNFPGMSFSPAVLSGWAARHHEPAGGRQLQHLRHGPALEGVDPADRHTGDRHRAVYSPNATQICFESDRGG